jgi:hypothetical protein
MRSAYAERRSRASVRAPIRMWPMFCDGECEARLRDFHLCHLMHLRIADPVMQIVA